MKPKYFVGAVFSAILLLQQLVHADDKCAFQNQVGGDDPKATQLGYYTVNDAGTQETTNFGQRVNNTDSLKAGLRGPTLLEDFMMREKIMHFGTSQRKYLSPLHDT